MSRKGRGSQEIRHSETQKEQETQLGNQTVFGHTGKPKKTKKSGRFRSRQSLHRNGTRVRTTS